MSRERFIPYRFERHQAREQLARSQLGHRFGLPGEEVAELNVRLSQFYHTVWNLEGRYREQRYRNPNYDPLSLLDRLSREIIQVLDQVNADIGHNNNVLRSDPEVYSELMDTIEGTINELERTLKGRDADDLQEVRGNFSSVDYQLHRYFDRLREAPPPTVVPMVVPTKPRNRKKVVDTQLILDHYLESLKVPPKPKTKSKPRNRKKVVNTQDRYLLTKSLQNRNPRARSKEFIF